MIDKNFIEIIIADMIDKMSVGKSYDFLKYIGSLDKTPNYICNILKKLNKKDPNLSAEILGYYIYRKVYETNTYTSQKMADNICNYMDKYLIESYLINVFITLKSKLSEIKAQYDWNDLVTGCNDLLMYFYDHLSIKNRMTEDEYNDIMAIINFD